MKLRLFIPAIFLLLNSITVKGQTDDSLLVRGADVSFTPQIEALGGKYFFNGIEKDALDILKENGVNYIRLRLWHTPRDTNRMRIWNTLTDTAGYCGTAKTLAYAKRVKAKGLKLLLDFHYSDWWADPGKQNKPAAWSGLSYSDLKDSVYQYTKTVLEKFKSEGALPDMVQIGNEITAGILWPDGSNSSTQGWVQLGELVKNGIRGAKDGAADSSMKIMIHIDRGGDNSTARWFYDNLIAQGVQFDVIGLSYYPWWHGTLAVMKANLNDLAVRYNKPIVIAETAYPWTTQYLNDGMADVGLGSWTPPAGYPITMQGQKAYLFALKKIIKETTNNKGLGWFYWEPAYISVSPIGSSWEHFTTFDYSGNAQSTVTAFMNFDTIRPVNVKLRFNTSTNPDTLKPTGVMQVRGFIKGLGSNLLPSGVLVTADANTQLIPQNVGGDYWENQISMYPSDSLIFKLWTGHSSSQQTYWNIGTEGKILAYDNSNLNQRLIIAGVNDTIIPLQFYSNSLATNVPQYWSQFQSKQDSIGILFRVNLSDLMTRGLFDSTVNGPVAVRGDSASTAGALSWYTNKLVLTHEAIGVAGRSFWSGVCYFPKTSINMGNQIKYKFYIDNIAFGGWESNISDRTFPFPQSDTTLAWKFFNNKLLPTSVDEQNQNMPRQLRLDQNYPNPFNPSTVIPYTIARRSHVQLNIYNLLGQSIVSLVNTSQEPGEYTAAWNGTDNKGRSMASGVYFVRLNADGSILLRKILLVK
jgi:arabinogalactan endo-1,4-beta-galactosidase